MRIVALEEHYTVPRIVAGISPDAIARRGFPGPDFVWAQTTKRNELADLGDTRLADMDASGITVQVLSVAGPGADLVPASRASTWRAPTTTRWPRPAPAIPPRYRGFAHLPMLAPEAAADELERTVKHLGFHGALVNGATDGRFLDDPAFEPILARAEALDVPIYLHPGIPTPACATPTTTTCRAISASPWRCPPGAGTPTPPSTCSAWCSAAPSTVIPGFKIVIGHMGEALPFMLDRIDETTAAKAKSQLRRSVRQTILDQVWITTSGFFTMVPFLAALMSFGVDRIMFSVDYPFASNARARAFLDALPVSPADRAKIAHGNADRLLRLPG